MIVLAANGSRILRDLLDGGNLPIQAVKCPLSANSRQEVEAFRRYRPVLLHGWGPDYHIGQPVIPQPGLLRDLIPLSGSPYLSTHLNALPEDFAGEPTPQKLLERIRVNAKQLREIAGMDLLLENIPYYAGGASPAFTSDPAFITEALSAGNAGFLLDIAHARVSAAHRGMKLSDYLHSLPLREVREVHVSRPEDHGGVLRDRHLALDEDDFRLLGGLLPTLPNLQTVALEYGGLSDTDAAGTAIGRNDPGALKTQIERLHALLEECRAS